MRRPGFIASTFRTATGVIKWHEPRTTSPPATITEDGGLLSASVLMSIPWAGVEPGDVATCTLTIPGTDYQRVEEIDLLEERSECDFIFSILRSCHVSVKVWIKFHEKERLIMMKII